MAIPFVRIIDDAKLRRRYFCLVFVFMVLACAPTSGTGNQQTTIGPMPIDFEHLQRRASPNDYLLCPLNLCQSAKPDRTLPSFPISTTELRKRLDSLAAASPRTRIVSEVGTQLVFEQRSAVFGFPDIIDIRVIDLEANRSTLAIYSRSLYGYYDFGANKRRVERWLRELTGVATLSHGR